MTRGLYFRLGYTYAHAIDDGQEPLVAGRPATVQNSYSPSSERGNSVTDQTSRFVFSWIYEPRPEWRKGLARKNLEGLKGFWSHHRGSGRPVSATVIGDANQDDNSNNDRLPGARRNFFTDPTTPPPICACRASSTLT